MNHQLAIDGGQPVTTQSFPSPIHGADEISELEINAVVETLQQKKPFRFLHDSDHSKVARFEKAFREFIGTDYALAVTGGTTALISGLVGLGIGSGDEVIIPAYTYIASAAAVLSVRSIPVIAEIDDSLTIDPADIERKITPQTRAIMPVHMRGTPCQMDKIMEIARNHNLKVLEDVAQANGGSFHGTMLGAIGDAGAFSLQYFKMITSGEGGMVVTNDEKTFARATMQHDSAMIFWDREGLDIDPFAGENYRMNEIQGALGLVQLQRIRDILGIMRKRKATIVAALKNIDGLTLQRIPDPVGDCAVSVCFFLPDEQITRKFSAALKAEGIPNGTLFDKTIPDRHIYYYWDYVMNKTTADRNGCPWTCPYYKGKVFYSKEMCPQTLGHLGRTLVIPISQKITEQHVEWIISGVKKVAGKFL